MTLSEKMIPVYANLVKAGLRTVDQVPEGIRDFVAAMVAGE